MKAIVRSSYGSTDVLELWLVANSIGDTAAADFVRRLYSTLTPLAERLTRMLDSGDERDRARVAEIVYRIQTSVAGAYVDAQRELDAGH